MKPTWRRAAFLIAMCAAAVLVADPARATCPGFSVTPDYPVGDSPRSIAEGDFNVDGAADLAFANYSSSTISTLLGNRDGTFTPSYTVYALGGQPTSIVSGDFNGDGKSDLAVSHLSGYVVGTGVFILLSYGDGSFTAPVHYPVTGVPQAISAADFDHDGNVDLAIGTYISGQPGNVSILLGNGNGTFASAVNYQAGNAPAALTVGDLDRDGYPDIVVANSGSSTVSILRGNGGGTFDPATSYGVGSDPESVAAADLDGNGTLDLVVGNTGSSEVSVLLGNGAGAFTPAVNYSLGAAARSVACGDFDSDGKRDIAIATGVADGSGLVIMRGNGDGTLAEGQGYNTGSNPPTALRVGDFDRDGRADIVTSNFSSSTASVFLNASICSLNCGTFAGGTSYAAGTSPGTMAIGDLDGNGTRDIGVVNPDSNELSLLPGNGDGTFAAPTTAAVGTSPSGVAFSDFNLDGKQDVAVCNEGSDDISILLGNGDGTVNPAVSYAAGVAPRFIVVQDLNRDGIPDVAVANSGSNDVSVLLGDGSGAFASPTSYDAGTSPDHIVADDFNRDGKTDLAISNGASDDVSVFFGNGDGTLAAPSTYAVGSAPSSLTSADLNRDGRIDLVVANQTSNTVSILMGNSGGTFASAVNYATGSQPKSVTVRDLNGDGNPDVFTANSGASDISILLGVGDGTVMPPSAVTVESAPQSVGSDDFDSDGNPDLIAANGGSNTISVRLNTCSPPDLTISKAHTGDFKKGQIGGTYSVTVTNSGSGRATGTITVTDNMPAALTATSIAGTGWICDLPSLTCTREDELLPGDSFPAITITVDVAFDAPSSVTNNAEVSASGETNTSNNTADDQTTILDVPDLIVTKSHDGNFAQGQSGRIYSLVVRNTGAAATSAPVEVSDALPAGLEAVGLSGLGWTCDVSSMSCMRQDSIAAGGSYPPVTVIVNVAIDAPASVINTASVSGGGETDSANNTATDPTTILVAPANLMATAISTSQVSATWNAVPGATRYQVWRSSENGPPVIVGFPATNYFIDVSLTPDTTYVYLVRATDDSNVGPASSTDIATTILFTDDPIVARQTMVKAAHFTELQTAINAVRVAAGLPPAVFAEIGIRGVIKASDVIELRDSIDEARAALQLPAVGFTDGALAPRDTVKAVHIRELRTAVQ